MGRSAPSSYDPVGNVVGTTDGDGNPTSYTYDALKPPGHNDRCLGAS